ncbi:acetamidase [Sulfolobus sp. S-194]|uniref:acetamidase/formamidase family protein n=1 Tax=Sulfolobus sp. S-194 TaxID=2512240 RepID=UPI001436D0F8|nr:acetamidase/formamidase family protein [Sulfolobus sp. S-194]QIW23962.1 acetamidase [Sulfolobus sp. S-194]
MVEKTSEQIITSYKRHHYIKINENARRCKDDPVCHNRWDPDIEPILDIEPGDIVSMETRDFLDGQPLDPDFSVDKIKDLDLTLAHPLTGPIYVKGAEAGDLLEVEILDVDPGKKGWTVIIPGFNFLRDLFPNPWLAVWDLSKKIYATSEAIPKVRIPAQPFMGVMGTAFSPEKQKEIYEREEELRKTGGLVFPPEPSTAVPLSLRNNTRVGNGLRTLPPRENGGNMDNRLLQKGVKVYFPVWMEGGLFSTGDAHFHQGDGEVAITPIEMPATFTGRFKIIKGGAKLTNWHTFYEIPDEVMKRISYRRVIASTGIPIKKKGEVIPQYQYLKGIHGEYAALINTSEDANLAVRNALLNIIEYLEKRFGLTKEQAFALCSIVGELRLSGIVDVPNILATYIFPLDIFEDYWVSGMDIGVWSERTVELK